MSRCDGRDPLWRWCTARFCAVFALLAAQSVVLWVVLDRGWWLAVLAVVVGGTVAAGWLVCPLVGAPPDMPVYRFEWTVERPGWLVVQVDCAVAGLWGFVVGVSALWVVVWGVLSMLGVFGWRVVTRDVVVVPTVSSFGSGVRVAALSVIHSGVGVVDAARVAGVAVGDVEVCVRAYEVESVLVVRGLSVGDVAAGRVSDVVVGELVAAGSGVARCGVGSVLGGVR